ncbi:uncharacterized protein LOC119684004 [Teleopsis dalmanni]|uniref:uncharacterized protein LOC119684004 n=1 Tax=Teleopsis dalmanni TaxID=139649 RepID=UPI0018CD3FB8|nr:uncharacterized protein LOC119684004 [Teleopsis dalmanni]
MSAPHFVTTAEELSKIRSLNRGESTSSTSSSLLDTPVWLSTKYIQKSLRIYYNDHTLKVNNINITPALGRGENYGGVLTRINAEYVTGTGQHQVGHYIVKTSFEGDELARQIMEPYDIFNCEMSIYESVLPKLNTLLREIGDNEQIFAATMNVDYRKSALIFEDLTMRGFTNPDRLQGLDKNLSKMVLKKLAKMHAASAVLNEREPRSLEHYDRGMYNRHTDNYAPCFVGLLEAMGRRLRQWPGYEHYAQKIEKLRPMYMELAKRVFDPLEGRLNVLAHGDIWTNNVMVKYDKESGNPLDAVIIDFQYSAWGSPAIDLFYFFNTSLNEELQLAVEDELIQYYYEILADTLKKLRYKAKIPSLHSFHMELEEKAFYAFCASCILQAVQRNEDTHDADFNALMLEDERAVKFKDSCYDTEFSERIVKKFLPVYDRRGLLEPDQ